MPALPELGWIKTKTPVWPTVSVVGFARLFAPDARVTWKFWCVLKLNVPLTLANVPENVADIADVPTTNCPVPFGVTLILALLRLTILFPFTSRFPPNWGVVSPTTSVEESETLTVFAEVLKVAKKLQISSDTGKGYRALANINENGGQEVPHLHFHLFGGEKVGKMVEWWFMLKEIS